MQAAKSLEGWPVSLRKSSPREPAWAFRVPAMADGAIKQIFRRRGSSSQRTFRQIADSPSHLTKVIAACLCHYRAESDSDVLVLDLRRAFSLSTAEGSMAGGSDKLFVTAFPLLHLITCTPSLCEVVRICNEWLVSNTILFSPYQRVRIKRFVVCFGR